ncbi:hypothetical protein J437_LFUL008252 [Ladona fulva]|uniref:UBZ1-type domain-containing protein n=1 Tax=Ladona fulva TaxID=123851 RepID=A0A8K0KA06_LADFU|nr:hypothetical protein J437_LFUL008252 [Ladona fulva]
MGKHVEKHVLHLQSEARALDADRNETGDKLGHAQRHIMVLEATIEALGALNENLMLALKELSNLKSSFEDKDRESKLEIESVHQVLSSTEKELEASKQRTMELEALYSKQSKLLESEREEVNQLKEQVKEMQLRLEMAAEEYRKVYAAHIRAERRLSRRQHSGGRSGGADDSGGGSRTRDSRDTRRTVVGSSPPDGETGEQKVTNSVPDQQTCISGSSGTVDENISSSSNNDSKEGAQAVGFGRGRALESLHDMNVCFVCPICSVTFPPGDSALFSSHFQNHLS